MSESTDTEPANDDGSKELYDCALLNETESIPDLISPLPMYERLGSVIRSLHETLQALGADGVITQAACEFPTARERLVHIGVMTEKAANTVLTKVEEARPIQTALANTAGQLLSEWDKVPADTLAPADLKSLAEQTKAFLATAQEGCKTTDHALSDIMMAQDFQDLTGQLIKTVVTLMLRTETDLLKLLIDSAPPGTISMVKNSEILAGPGSAGAIGLDQSTIDTLLAKLGF